MHFLLNGLVSAKEQGQKKQHWNQTLKVPNNGSQQAEQIEDEGSQDTGNINKDEQISNEAE